jgi:hypothetical protein
MPVMIWRAPMVRVRDGRSCRWPMSRFQGAGPCFQARASSSGRMIAMTPSPMRAMAAKCFQRLDARDMDTT